MTTEVRKGQGDVKLTREEFERRLRERFYDPEFQRVERQIAEIVHVAWLKGWGYPRHLAGHVFSVVVHGDTVGAETLRRSLSDWLTDMKLLPAMAQGGIDRYIGYYEPYATSHDALDRDAVVQREVRNAAKALVEAVPLSRAGRFPHLETESDPRPK